MNSELAYYLESIRGELRLSPAEERCIISEVCLHLQEEVQELTAAGLSRQEAIHRALAHFGPPRVLGRQFYEAHHRGSWREALLAAAPHLALAAILSLQLTPLFLVVAGFLALAAAVTLWGWWKGKPAWLYPWVGYSLVAPLVAGVVAVSALVRAGVAFFSDRPLPLEPLAYLGLLTYVGVLGGMLFRVVARVARRDWTLVSLMLMPLPLLVWLLLSLQSSGKDVVYGLLRPPLEESAVVVAFLALASASVGFVRFRQRHVKIWMLLTIVPIFVLIGLGGGSVATVAGALALSLLSLALLLSPALLERKARRGAESVESWGDFLPHLSGLER